MTVPRNHRAPNDEPAPPAADERPQPADLAPPERRSDQQRVRHRNLSTVLRLLARDGPRSRAVLAELTGLTKATISALVADLLERGLVDEVGRPGDQRRGRPATLVAVSSGYLALGLVIDVDHVAVCATDLTGRVVCAERAPSDNASVSARAAIGKLQRLASPVVAELRGDGHTIDEATLAVPGLVDPGSGTVVVAPNLGWEGIDTAKHLSPRLSVGLRVANEADLAAVAELALGWGRMYRDFVVVSTGVGVGAGVVMGGRVFHGAHGFGGELGHFVIDPLGPPCPCGNRGCLERYVGRRSLPAALGARDDDEWPHAAAEAARRGAPRVIAALEEVAERLARGLVSAVHLFDPEAVVLAGDLAPLSPWIAPPLQEELASHVLGARWTKYDVVASQLGRDVGGWGAALASAERVLDDPLAIGA
jgi:predicted NBD/HSP70 family sugar kinase